MGYAPMMVDGRSMPTAAVSLCRIDIATFISPSPSPSPAPTPTPSDVLRTNHQHETSKQNNPAWGNIQNANTHLLQQQKHHWDPHCVRGTHNNSLFTPQGSADTFQYLKSQDETTASVLSLKPTTWCTGPKQGSHVQHTVMQ